MPVRRNTNISLSQITASLKAMSGKEVKVGWIDGTRYEDGTPVAGVAVVQELGSVSQKIPPRPFIRPTVEEKSDEWSSILERGAKTALNTGGDFEIVLEALGLKVAGDLRQKIASITSPPLKPETAERKGSTKPLVDTGLLINSITSSVE